MTVAIKKSPAVSTAKATFVQKVIKEDTYLVMAASQNFAEDEFVNLYYSTTDTSKVFLEPPYNPKLLSQMVVQNNILSQCIDAMEVNVDGTGHEFVSVEDGKEPDEAEVKKMSAFFAEPYPNKSFITLRRDMRRDLESCGYACLEVLRNAIEDVVGVRNLPSYMIRLVRLDAPVLVTKVVNRDGKDVELKYWDRERRFVQRTAFNTFTYFREFGSSRNINRKSGDWESETNKVAPEDRGSEVLYFRVSPDVETPYGVPRWVNQIPSVVGSRKAEEQNLEFFDAGGMPPAIIFIEGGTLAGDMAAQLKTYLSGQLKNKHRAVVVEAQSSSGSIESSGKVTVRTERFGSTSGDPLYKDYDRTAEEHVRIGFRLPPLFIGRSSDYSYATAQVSYMVAEAQVFQPERHEFDEIINHTLMKALGATSCKFKSKAVTLKDVETVIRALTMAMPVSEGEGFIQEVNKLTGLTLVYKAPPLPPPPVIMGAKPGETGVPGKPAPFAPKAGVPGAAAPKVSAQVAVEKSEYSMKDLLKLAGEFCGAEGLIEVQSPYTVDERYTIRKSVDALSDDSRKVFNLFVSRHVRAAIDGGYALQAN